MNFGQALEQLKLGNKVTREKWNNKEIYIALQLGSTIKKEQARGGIAKCLAEENVEDIIICPHLDMKDIDGHILVGWCANQSDILAEDWLLLE